MQVVMQARDHEWTWALIDQFGHQWDPSCSQQPPDAQMPDATGLDLQENRMRGSVSPSRARLGHRAYVSPHQSFKANSVCVSAGTGAANFLPIAIRLGFVQKINKHSIEHGSRYLKGVIARHW